MRTSDKVIMLAIALILTVSTACTFKAIANTGVVVHAAVIK